MTIEDAPIKFETDGAFDELWAQVGFALTRGKTAEGIKNSELEAVINSFVGESEVPGLIVTHVYFVIGDETKVLDDEKHEIAEVEIGHPLFPPNVWEDEVAIAALHNLGVVEQGARSSSRDEVAGVVSYVHLTRFGLELYLACNPDCGNAIDESMEQLGGSPRRNRGKQDLGLEQNSTGQKI